MRWEDERYVRLYTRDTPEFLALSWTARGLFALILRKVDRAGILEVGKLGLRGVAVAIGGPWVDVEGPLRELLEDGCVMLDEAGTAVMVPNFLIAQEAVQTDAARKRASREKARATFGGSGAASEAARTVLAEPPTPPPAERSTSPTVTKRDDMGSRNVTESHARSRAVTRGHSDPICAEPSRAEPSRDPSGGSAAAAAAPAAAKTSRRKPEPKTITKPEDDAQIAWRLWRAAYRTAKGKPYSSTNECGKQIKAAAAAARVMCAELGKTAPEDFEALLAHRWARYLADPGHENYLVDAAHALRFFERNVPAYGTPWDGPSPTARRYDGIDGPKILPRPPGAKGVGPPLWKVPPMPIPPITGADDLLALWRDEIGPEGPSLTRRPGRVGSEELLAAGGEP